MSSPERFPGISGIPATSPSAAAIISAMTLPFIEPFSPDPRMLAKLPDFALFPMKSVAVIAPEPVQAQTQAPPSGNTPARGQARPVLNKVDLARAVIDDCTDVLAALKKLEDTTAACKAAVIERMSSAAELEARALNFDSWQRDGSSLVIRAEVATTLVISESAAGSLIDYATILVRDRPATWASLASGKLSWSHAIVVAQEASTLRSAGVEAAAITAYEQSLLERCAGSTPPQFRDRARRLREKSHPESIDVRTRNAYACRKMETQRGRDGMSWLSLYLPAPTVEGIWEQTTALARASQGTTEQRTLTQLRADVAATLLLSQSLVKNHLHPGPPAHTPGPADGVYHGGDGRDAECDDARDAGDGTDYARRDAASNAGGDTGHNPASNAGGEYSSQRNNEIPTATEPECGLAAGYFDGSYFSASDPWENEILCGSTLPGMTNQETSSSVQGNKQDEVQNRVNRPKPSARVLPPMPDVRPVLTIPMLSLLGLSNAPAQLEGYGPLGMDVAKRLMAKAPSFYRVFTDPITGEALALNPDSRRVSKKMRIFLRSEDELCAFPGCTSKASQADYDHITAWAQGGRTIWENVEPLCPKHHKIKHFKDDRTRSGAVRHDQSPQRASIKLRGWTPVGTDAGRPGWISPSGRYFPPEPREVQAPQYPRWLKTRITQTFQNLPQESHCTANLSGPIDLSLAEALFSAYSAG
ncbi:HNH endonuclease signature motif containing protein [Arthrobacter cryoconiti]|uniref:DUF222 domain-containing protein n=2 Tax=Micrococcales TaxID=85006 RepID=A0ABV8R4F9_9MICC|nr:HNH endonuclease signature motif containing protein [Arthrobacter cryoconiti]MCC9068165.1 HNH endonuclease [Arthrobacter cryoconiti]